MAWSTTLAIRQIPKVDSPLVADLPVGKKQPITAYKSQGTWWCDCRLTCRHTRSCPRRPSGSYCMETARRACRSCYLGYRSSLLRRPCRHTSLPSLPGAWWLSMPRESPRGGTKPWGGSTRNAAFRWPRGELLTRNLEPGSCEQAGLWWSQLLEFCLRLVKSWLVHVVVNPFVFRSSKILILALVVKPRMTPTTFLPMLKHYATYSFGGGPWPPHTWDIPMKWIITQDFFQLGMSQQSSWVVSHDS